MRRLIVFVLAMIFVLNQPAQASPRQVSRAGFIKDMNVLFLKGDHSTLVRNAENNLARYRFTRIEKKEILYLIGLSYIKIDCYEKARSAFNDILKMKGNEFREDTFISIADSYFYQNTFGEAIKAYEDVLIMYPKSHRLSSIYYNLGLSYKAKEDFEKANYYFKKIENQYDGSFEADKKVYLPTEKKTSYYIIQLGAFKSLRNAKDLVRRLSKKGYDSYMQKIRENGDILYRVKGGKFSNEYYAMRLLNKLKKDGFSAKVIIE